MWQVRNFTSFACTYLTLSQISEAVLCKKKIAPKCYKMHTFAHFRWVQPSLKSAEQHLLKLLSCCPQLLCYFCLQWAVSRHTAEIRCYNFCSGCTDWHTLSNSLDIWLRLRSGRLLETINKYQPVENSQLDKMLLKWSMWPRLKSSNVKCVDLLLCIWCTMMDRVMSQFSAAVCH